MDPASFLALDPRDIKNISVYKPGNANQYGVKGNKNGTLDIILNKNIQLVSLSELFHLFYIQDKAFLLPKALFFGFVSGEQVSLQQPDLFFASQSMISSITVISSRQVIIDTRLLMWRLKNKDSTRWGHVVDSLTEHFLAEADSARPKVPVVVGP